MELEFSIKTRQAATVFTEYRNTIDIYTEDCEKDKEFYVKLLKRLLNDTNIIINDIHPLGCRRQVIKCCKDDTDKRRKKIYIVDGDIFLQYKEKEKIRNLYVLDAYCIENYMICEDAFCKVAYSLVGQYSPEEIKNKLNFTEELNNLVKPLLNLFFFYSIQMECTDSFKLMNIDTYLNNVTKKIDENTINKKVDEIKDKLLKSGIKAEIIKQLFIDRQSKFPYNENSLLRVVSGKDFLIPYIRHHIDKQFGCSIRIPKEAWKFNLVDYCDLNRLDSLKRTLMAL